MSIFSKLATKIAAAVASHVISGVGITDLWTMIKTAKAAADEVDDGTLTDAAQFIESLKDQGFGDDLITAIDSVCSLVGYDSAKIDALLTVLVNASDELIALIDTTSTTEE